jgi:predicted tellurium resistance membrane protein TerC
MDILIYLVGLSAMEIVLGIDNIVFISIVTGRLPPRQQPHARRIGLSLALVMRILLLLTLSWILQLQTPVFRWTDIGVPQRVFETFEAEPTDAAHAGEPEWEAVNAVSWKDLILIAGGLFLIGKSVHEIHQKIEGGKEHTQAQGEVRFASVLVQIVILDVIFSLDSVITAVGMVPPEKLWIMVVAVVLAVVVMLIFAGPVSNFIGRHPTLKMLALSFLILIGVMLVAEGIGTHINKGYIYFAMAFALVVELLNLRIRPKSLAAAPA